MLIIAFSIISCKTDEPVIKAQKVILSPSSLAIMEGDSTIIAVSIEPANANPTVSWTSSNEKVAIVKNGVLKAISRGTATITATADSINGTCNVTVDRVDLPYQLVWSDEFDGTSLDLTKWQYEIGGGGWGNQEKEYYTNRTENLRLENGNLLIQALKEVYNGNNYTSARINTRAKATFLYGKIEARISLPQGAGTWAAYWLLGSNLSTAKWPLCGEIDIMEHIGSQPTMISHATHTSEKNGSKGNNWYNRKTITDAENNFHTYTIEWEKSYNEGDDCISFLIDGVKSTTIWEPHINSTVQVWPFKKDFFVILNLAIGGTMGGTVNDAIFDNPVIMKVDYVRFYQRK